MNDSESSKREARSRGGSRLKQAHSIAMRKRAGSHQEPSLATLKAFDEPQLAAAENQHPIKRPRKWSPR